MISVNRKITDPLWLATACTAPLFSVSFLRITLPFLNDKVHVPIAGIFILLIIGIEIGGLFFGSTQFPKNLMNKGYGKLAVLITAFLGWHLLSLTKSSDLAFGIKCFLRLFTGVACGAVVVLFLPRDRAFLKRFFIVFSWAMGLLLVYLIYTYAFVFKLTYLSSDLDLKRYLLPENRVGKNQLAYFVAKVFPFAFFIFRDTRLKVIAFFPLFVMSIAVIYAASRGTWISITLGFMALTAFTLCHKKHFSSSGLFRIIILLLSVFCLAFLVLSLYVPISEVAGRFISIFDPSAVHEKLLGRYSYESRGAVFLQAWKGFLTSPVVGVGLGNSTNYSTGLVHNDYLSILLELGAIGFILFFGILWQVFQKVWRHLNSFKGAGLPWSYWSVPCSLVALLTVSFFYDNYLAAYYWMFLGLYLVVIEADEAASGERKE